MLHTKSIADTCANTQKLHKHKEVSRVREPVLQAPEIAVQEVAKNVPALEYCQLQLTGSHTGNTIIIVRVPVLCVTAELGLRVPVREYRQLQTCSTGSRIADTA